MTRTERTGWIGFVAGVIVGALMVMVTVMISLEDCRLLQVIDGDRVSYVCIDETGRTA
ncbi:MAG: hypothetical protein R3324_15310 [Halobacteriales archaeon]|nr:hypothetical protein [Halobacteriales archaeon]